MSFEHSNIDEHVNDNIRSATIPLTISDTFKTVAEAIAAEEPSNEELRDKARIITLETMKGISFVTKS